jgi:hypothetical protein
MKQSLAIAALVLLLTAAALAIPYYLPCPVDELQSRWTGEYKYVDGVRMAIYRCPRGHKFQVRCPLGDSPH